MTRQRPTAFAISPPPRTKRVFLTRLARDGFTPEPGVSLVEHARLEGWLAADPVGRVFPLFVCRTRPEGRSLAAAAGALVRALRERGRLGGLQLPWALAGCVGELAPDARVSRDVYLERPPGPARLDGRPGRALALDPAALRRLEQSADMRSWVGALEDLPPGATMYGLEVEGRLVALADVIVRYGEVATVQQVICEPDLRGRGYGSAVVAAALELGAAGMRTTWLASADNEPSIRLARGLGFALRCELGFLAVE